MNIDQIYKDLGKRIRDRRKSLPQTQDQFAKQAGISRASLANIEAGRQRVLVHHLLVFARILRLDSPAQLLPTESSNPPRDSDSDYSRLPKKGLTKNQRQEIINLLGDVPDSNHINPKGESK